MRDLLLSLKCKYMNKIYKVLWNDVLNRYVVVSDFAKSKKKSKSSVNRTSKAVLGLGLSALFAADTLAAPLPSLTVYSTISETGVARDSATGPAVIVTAGGDYTGIGITVTSQAPSPGGNMAAFTVNSGGKARLDSGSSVTMASTSAPVVCCTYGLYVDGVGSQLDSAATVIGSTGGAGVYNGGLLNLSGSSLSGLFGIVSSGAGSLITSTNTDISGSGAGTGVRVELGAGANLTGGHVLSNGMVATGSGSTINSSAVSINGQVTASNGGNINLAGGSVTAGGFGVSGVTAFGPAASHISTSADITITGGGGGATAVRAMNSSTIDVTGGQIIGDTTAITAVSGSKVTVSNANMTANSVGVYADNAGSRVDLMNGTLTLPGWNNIAVSAENGAVVENHGATITGGGSSSIGAQAINGGSVILDADGTVTGSGTGVKAAGAGSTVTNNGTLSATKTAAYATNNGQVNIDGGSFSATGSGAAAIVADSGGKVNVATAALLNAAVVAGSGVQANSGGTVNLKGGSLNVTAANSTGLGIDGAGSAITSSAPLTVNTTGAQSNGLVVANTASATFSDLTINASGVNGNAVQSNSGSNQLTLTDSIIKSTHGAAIAGKTGSLNIDVTGSQVAGEALLKDNGSAIALTAKGASVLEGTAQGANSSVTLNSDSHWNLGGGNSSLSSLTLDDSTLKNMSNANLTVSGDVILGAEDSLFDTNGFDAVLAMNSMTGSGNLNKAGTGKLTVAGAMDYAGTTNITAGTLQIGNGTSFGDISLSQVNNNGVLAINSPDNLTIDLIAGSGAINQIGNGTTVLLGDNTYTAGTTISAGTLQLGNGGSTGSIMGDIEVQSAGELAIKRNGSFTLANALTGSGLITTDTAGNAFALNAATGNAFAGTLAIGNSTFALSGDNTAALANAALRADTSSTITVGTGEQAIGGLAFNGGLIKFGSVTPGKTTSSGIIKATNGIDLREIGTVQVDIGNVVNNGPMTLADLPLLEQDDANIKLQLARTNGVVQGNAGNLALIDQDGVVISDVIIRDIEQSGATVAKGTWDYRLASGADADGLYVNYGLTEIDLIAQGANALVLNSNGATGSASDLSAKVTGSGDLHIDTGTSTVSLSNLANNYTGGTALKSGTLLLANENVLGDTSNLVVENGATIDTQGYSQHIGALNTATGSKVNLAEGSELTITGDQRSSGDSNGGAISADTLAGNGKLVVDSSVITVNGANTAYTGDVTLEGGSQSLLNDVAGLGNSGLVTLTDEESNLTFAKQLTSDADVTGNLTKQLAGVGTLESKEGTDINLAADNSAFSGEMLVDSDSDLRASAAQHLGDASIVDNGALHLTTDSDWEVKNAIKGSGSLEKLGIATLIVNRDLAYTGETDVQSGRLVIGTTPAAEGKLSGSSVVNIASGAVLGGNGEVSGTVNNFGTLASLNALSGYGSMPASQFTVGDLNNHGEIKLTGTTPGNTLTVKGNYVGDNGLLSINTALGKDNSQTDKLVVEGNTSGSTRVQVNNLGGKGDVTSKGIEVIQVGGKSEGDFKLQGRAVAGAYDYFLNKGQAKDGNWYLQSQMVTPVDPVNPVAPVNPVDPVNPDAPSAPIVRPEAAAYSANIAAANTLFSARLHDRLGETHYVDALTGEDKVTSMWMRNVGGHTRSKDSSGQLSTQSNRYVMQIGGDIAQWSSNKDDRFHLGVMAGYANQKSNTRSNVTHYRADGSISGYSAGVYATWLQDSIDHTGAYVDMWGLYNWFDNDVKGESLSSESYKSKGFTTSIEAGYTWKTGERDKDQQYFIQPKAQITWMGVDADDHHEANGTKVTAEGKGNIQTRLGVRAFIKGRSTLDEGKERTFEPFVEANWIHNTKTFGTRLNDVKTEQAGTKNIGELKAGVEGQISRNVNVWGNVAQQIGDKGYSDSSAMLGIKVNF